MDASSPTVYCARMSERRYRKRVKAAILRSRIPMKGALARAYLRSKERYLDVRAGREPAAEVNGVPVPPPRLRILVSGTPDLDTFLRTGELQARYLRDLVAGAAQPLEQMSAVLDFGCGCGRILRWFADASGTELHGCDYNAELVRWCESNLRFMRARANTLQPPLPYAGETFDFLYAFSVFTHLSVELASDWLDELQRVVKPGGLVWFTLHGEGYRDRLLPEEQARFDDGEIVVWLPEIEGTNMCGAYWPDIAVSRMLGDRFQILTHFNPKADPSTAERIELAHDAYLIRRL
jgi:SAM-dependent methyltransferase